MQNHNFRLVWISEGISLLGDQFCLIALPWFILSLTGNPLAVGMVLATAGIPRALFMLAGEALTGRFTPRRLMINSNLARMILTGLLVTLVLRTSSVERDFMRAYHNHANGNLVKPAGCEDFKELMGILCFYWLRNNVSPNN